MAKGSPFTTFTGKLGQTVGFIIKNSESKQVQGIRAYQAVVSNPKSALQSNQRLMLKPLNNMAKSMKEVIERGFEGVKYGAQSRQKFLSLNMAADAFKGPFVVKGTEAAVPGPVIISQGSLVPVGVTLSSPSSSQHFVISDLFLGRERPEQNWGACSRALIANNTNIQDGDQLTFIYVIRVADTFVYRVFSKVVDTTSTDVIGGASGGSIWWEQYSPTGSSYSLAIFGRLADDETLVAGACIQSRDGDTQHLRSTSYLVVSDDIAAEYQSAEALAAAIASYGASGGSNDWPTEKISTTPLRAATVTIPASLVSNAAATKASGYVTEGGEQGIYVAIVGGEYYPLDANGSRIKWMNGDVDDYVKLTDAGKAQFVATKLYQVPFGAEVGA